MIAKKSEKTLASFRALFDPDVRIPAAINAALESLAKDGGPEAWEYEADFIKRAGISTSQIGVYREQFDKHIAVAREKGKSEKKAWFADSKVAAKARKEPKSS